MPRKLPRSKVSSVCVLTTVLAIGFAHGSCARGAEPRAQISKLFDLAAKSTPPAVAAAKAQYDQLNRGNPQDRRLDYAYALVLIQQHKYHDALASLGRYLESPRPDWTAYQLQIWAQIQERRYTEALAAAVALSGRFAKATDRKQAQLTETAEFLGTIFGYLELARPAAISTELRAARRAEVLARIGKEYTAAFDKGRNKVATQLAELQAEQKTKQDLATSVIEKKQEQKSHAVEEDKLKASAQKDKANATGEQLSEAQREVSVLKQQAASLTQDRTRVSAQIIVAQAELAQIYQEAPSIFQIGQPSPSGRANQMNVGASPFDPRYVRARALAFSLAALNKQAFDMDRKMLGFKSRVAELSGQGAQQAQTIERSTATAEQAEKHAKALEKHLKREEALPKPHPGALTGKMTMLSTYAPFPYEREKARVLGWFAK